MKNIFSISLILFCLSKLVFSQQELSLGELKKTFESFEYNTVIELSDKILETKINLSDEDKIEIYRLKAIAAYSLWNEDLSAKSFTEILKINSNYSLDEIKTSPKIVNFFKKIKIDYLKNISQVNRTTEDTISLVLQQQVEQPKVIQSGYTPLYTFIPGYAQIQSGSLTKGWILSSLAAVSLGSMLYFVFDCNSKEEKYLNENQPALIESKYNSYNTAYKSRNISIAAVVAIWLYSQIDFYLFGGRSELSSFQSQLKINPHSNHSFEIHLPINF